MGLTACNNDDEAKTVTLSDLNGTWKEVTRHSLNNTRNISCADADPKLLVFYENDTYRQYEACSYSSDNWEAWTEEGGTSLEYGKYLWLIDGQKVHDYQIKILSRNRIKFELRYDHQRGDVQGEYSVYERVSH
jgi:hypothetical protein